MTQNRVDEAQKQIEEKTAQIEKDQQRLSDRARDMYRSGDTNFLDVILGASSFEQFATTWNMLETLNGNDAELFPKPRPLAKIFRLQSRKLKSRPR